MCLVPDRQTSFKQTVVAPAWHVCISCFWRAVTRELTDQLFAVEQEGKQQSFHVVVPSMPGFAFSGQPKRPGYGPKEMGEAVNNLMLKLGYNRYVAQGAAHTSLCKDSSWYSLIWPWYQGCCEV